LQILFTEAQNGWLDASVVLKFSQVCRDGEYFPAIGRTMPASYKRVVPPFIVLRSFTSPETSSNELRTQTGSETDR